MPAAGAAGPGHCGTSLRNDVRHREEPSDDSGKVEKNENGAVSVVSVYRCLPLKAGAVSCLNKRTRTKGKSMTNC